MQNMDLKSTFQLKEYHISKLLFDQPWVELSEENKKLSYFARLRYAHCDGHWEGTICLGFRYLNPDETQDPSTIQESIILGLFTEDLENTSEMEAAFVKHLKINGASTLIPILRGAICSASAMMGYPGKYTLPNINTFSLCWSCDNLSKGEE